MLAGRGGCDRAAGLTALLALNALAGCVPPVEMPPPPKPASVPLPPPSPPKLPEQPWDVAPVASGDWSYRQDGNGTVASFGVPGRQADLSMRCHPAAHEIVISRFGPASPRGTMTIRTSAGDLNWPAVPSAGGLQRMMATRPARDPGFDWIAYSRGRFAVEVTGMARLIMPAWAEVSRVIEDCRG